MKSYIKDFQGEHKKDSDLVITVDGMAATGKGTLGRFLAEKADIKHFSASDVFYEVAEERGLEDHELSEEAEKDLDLEIDRRTLQRALNQDCVVEGRIPSHVLGSYSDFRIKMVASPEERARRLAERDDIEKSEAPKIVEKRDREDSRRYKEYYDLDTDNEEIYDLVLDNTHMSVEKQNKAVEKELAKKFPERFGK